MYQTFPEEFPNGELVRFLQDKERIQNVRLKIQSLKDFNNFTEILSYLKYLLELHKPHKVLETSNKIQKSMQFN